MTGLPDLIPNYSLQGLVNFLTKQGIALDALLQELDCELSDLTENHRRFTLKDYENLSDFASQTLNCPNLGFKHGTTFEVGEWGLLGHIVMASKNLWQALGYQKRYQCLVGSTGQAYHEIQGSNVIMRWLSEPNATPNSIEQVITAWVCFAFNHTISEDKPLSVNFVHSPIADVDEYEEFFDCEVNFNASFNGLIFKEKSLHLPLINQNQEVLNVLCCHAEHLLSEKRASASLNLIHQFIVELLPTKVPELSDIAEHLGMSTRQVQRQFQKENTSLTALLEAIRKSLAISYLNQTDHKLLYISTMLGYSEQSAFQRAFKRWTGQTPQSYRLRPMP